MATDERPVLNLVQAIDGFLADAGTGSRYTRRTYRTALNRMLEYLDALGLDAATAEVDALRVDLILNMGTWLLDVKRVHKRTLHTYMTAVMSFCRYLHIRGRLPLDSSDQARLQDGIRRLRMNQRPPRLLPHPPREEELHLLLQAARGAKLKHQTERDHLMKQRNIAIVETLLSTGLRVGELVSLRRRDLDRSQRSARVIGKGNKPRQIYFSDFAWDSIARYLELRRPLDLKMKGAAGDLPVFSRHDRRSGTQILPLGVLPVQTMLRDLAVSARLEERGITPHALRHYFGTRMYQATSDLAVTQTALGHSSPQTTRIYAELRDNAVKDAHEKAFRHPPSAPSASSTSAATSSDRSTS